MSETKAFRIQNEDQWNQFVGKIKAEGKTIESVLNEFIQSHVGIKEESATPSYYTDLFRDYLLTLDLSNVIKNKSIHLNLDQKEFYFFIESVATQIKPRLQEALTEALRLFWCHKQAQKLGLDSEQTKQLELKWNLPKLNGFKKVCNNIKITYSVSCLSRKSISDFKITDLNKILETNVVVIGPAPRKYDTIKQDYVQKILVQEFESEAKNNNPMIIKAVLFGDHNVGSGQRIKLIGRYKISEPENGKPIATQIPLYFEIFDILPVENEAKYTLTEQEIFVAKEMAEKDEDNFVQNIIESFAPHIHDRDLEKKAIILSVLGGSEMGENRNESHLMLCGEADTGKSELIKFLGKILSKCSIVDGANSTGQSLGFALDEYDGTKVLRAGALIQNNHGVVGIDEYDKMPKPEQKKLNRAMEQQTIKYDKGGHDAQAETKTTIIAACNPTNEKWKEDLPIVDNFPFDPSTLTRFDVVVRLYHDKNEYKSRKKIQHIFANMNNEQKQLCSPKYLGALLEYMKKQTPTFSKEAQKTLEDFYVGLKNLEQKEGSILIETRQMLGLIRLCKAYAKLTFRKIIDNEIVAKVIEFYKSTLRTLGMVTDVQMQIDLREQSLNKDEFFCEIFMNLAKDNEDGYVEIQPLTEKLLENTKFFKTERSINDYLRGKKEAGYCYEPHNGRWKRQ